MLRYALHSVSTSLSHHATFHVLANTRTRLLDKLATLPLGTVLDRSSGSYKNIIVERVDSIETTLAHLLPEMTANIAGALAVLVLLFLEDWRTGLSMLIVVPPGTLCFASMFSGYNEQFQRAVTAAKALNDTAVEYISGIAGIKPSASPRPATKNSSMVCGSFSLVMGSRSFLDLRQKRTALRHRKGCSQEMVFIFFSQLF